MINTLHPKVQAAANTLINLAASNGVQIEIVDALRGEARQAAIYAQGRKSLEYTNKLRARAELPPILESDNKWATNSKHANLSYHGYGLAFDIGIHSEGQLLIASKKVDWSSPGIEPWLTVARLSKQINGLEWGGSFTASPDIAHYQMTFGLTITDLVKGILP